jgi:hypothetical protein
MAGQPGETDRPRDEVGGTCLSVGLRRYRNFKYLTAFKSGYLDLESAAFPWAESTAESTKAAPAGPAAMVASSTILAIWLELLDNIRSCVIPSGDRISLLLRDRTVSYKGVQSGLLIHRATTVAAAGVTKLIEDRWLRVLPRDDFIGLLLRDRSVGYQGSQSFRHGLVFQFRPRLAEGIAQLVCIDAQDL